MRAALHGDGEKVVAIFLEPLDCQRQGVFHVALGLERVVEDDYRSVAGIALDVGEDLVGRQFL